MYGWDSVNKYVSSGFDKLRDIEVDKYKDMEVSSLPFLD